MLTIAGPGEPRLRFLPTTALPTPGRRKSTAASAAAAVAKGLDPPKRQTASDQRWEGDTWLSSAELAQNIEKKSKFMPASAAPALPADMPPKPKDPMPPKDPSSRRRDKDRIPSTSMYVPDVATRSWVLVPRPIVLQAGIFRAYRPLPPQQMALLQRLVALRSLDGASPAIDTEFLKKHLVPRLNRDHPASLRTLDWLVVDFAREMGIAYTWVVFGVPKVVAVHFEYTQYLAAHRRRHFDVFRRRHRVYFDVDGETYSTTAAQLHFFYIAFHLGFLHFAEVAAADIKAHMKAKLNANAEAKAAALAACPTKAPGRSALVGKCDLYAYSVEGGTKKEFCFGPGLGTAGASDDSDGDDGEDSDADADADADD